jgi:hypothetical protein
MSQIRNKVRRQRRISSLLFSLLSRVRGWLDGWLKRHRSACSTIQPQPRHRSTLHFEALEPRLLLSADLAAGTLTHDALLPLVPGDPISALFEVHRADDEALAEPVRIAFYASADGVLDAADTRLGQIDVTAAQWHPGINPISVSLDASAIARPGHYALIGVIDPDNAIVESIESNNQALAVAPLQVEFAVGQLAGRSPVPSLAFSDADGTRLTLSIVGPGVARLEETVNGYQLTLAGTDASSRVELTGSGGDGRVVLSGITAGDPLGSLVAPIASLTGAARFAALANLTLGDIASDGRLEGDSLSNLKVNGDALGDLQLSGRGASGYVLGNAQVGGAIAGLWSISGRAYNISAQSTRADWRANISASLTALVVQGDAAGQLATPALQFLQVAGSLRGMTLRIGADLGSDATLGGSGSAADRFGAGTLARLRVNGDIVDSLIVVGIDPGNGAYFDGDDRQLGSTSNRVQELFVGGRLTGDTQIIAPAFPASVRINGVVLKPGSVGQLSSTPADRHAPTLTAGLLDDSGDSANDGLTRDPSMAGQASDAGGVARLLAALDPSMTPTLVDLSSALQADGRFVLSAALLDALAGGTLADGSHRLRLLAEDAAGNASAPTDIAFTLDRSAPIVSLELDPAFDTGQAGDGETEAASVELLVSSEAGTRVELLDALDHTLADAVADADGKRAFCRPRPAARRKPFQRPRQRCRRQQPPGRADADPHRPRHHRADRHAATRQR